MKPGIATIAFRKYDVFTALDFAAEAGFMGVEIWGKPSHTPAEFDEEHFRKVRDHAKRNRLEVVLFGSYANPSWPEFDRVSADAISTARLLGAKVIRVWAGNKEPHEADDELWEHVTRCFHEFALRAENQGLTLAIEMHANTLCLTAEGALRVLEMSNAPNLKLNYQVGDPANPDLDRVLPMIGPHVVNVHAQNFRPSCLDKGKMELCWIEEGLVDYDRALSLLAKQGFNGYVEVEFLKGEHCCEGTMMESLHKDAQYLRTLTAKYSR